MLIFTHIFSGAALGLVLALIIRDSRIILVGIVSAILPDIIDKPLGLFHFPQALDNARRSCHTTLLVVGIITAFALIAWRSWCTHHIFGLAGAVHFTRFSMRCGTSR